MKKIRERKREGEKQFVTSHGHMLLSEAEPV